MPAPAPPAKEDRLALNRTGTEGDDLDQVEAEMLEDWEELADDLMGAIAGVMDGATSYEDALKRLPEALSHMPTGLAVETLVKGMFKGRVLGDQRDE